MNDSKSELDKSKTIGESIEETRQYHERYYRAVNNPVRREILKAVKDGSKTVENLKIDIGLELEALNWHLSILEHGFCVEKLVKEGKIFYKITREGGVVEYF